MPLDDLLKDKHDYYQAIAANKIHRVTVMGVAMKPVLSIYCSDQHMLDSHRYEVDVSGYRGPLKVSTYS